MKYRCPKCGEVFEGPVKFCPHCGQALKITAPEEKPAEPKKKYRCPKCGTIFEGSVKFCPGCGAEIRIKEEPKVEEKSKFTCPVCGAIYDEPVKFCNQCGSEIKDGAATPAPAPVAPQVVVEQPKKEEPVDDLAYFANETKSNDPVQNKKTGNKAVGWIFVIFAFLFSLAGIVAGIAVTVVSFYDVLDTAIDVAQAADSAYPDLADPLVFVREQIDALPVVPQLIQTFGPLNLVLLIGAFVLIVMTFIFASIGHKNGGKVFNVFAIIFNIISILVFIVAGLMFAIDKVFLMNKEAIMDFIAQMMEMMGAGA